MPPTTIAVAPLRRGFTQASTSLSHSPHRLTAKSVYRCFTKTLALDRSRSSIITRNTPWKTGEVYNNTQWTSHLRLNGSSGLMPRYGLQASVRHIHITRPQSREHYFDTLKFVQRLQIEGFSEEQSVAMMKVLNDVIEESIQNLTRTMVLREDAAKATYTQKVDFAKLRSELLAVDSTELNTTRSSHERLANDLSKLNAKLKDEISRTQASVRLDLNLEKGRLREEAVSQELKIRETEAKIEQEVAVLRETLERVKLQTLQWLIGVCTGGAALLLGAWRLLM